MRLTNTVPAGALIEEALVDITELGSHTTPTIDGFDWAGSVQPNFSDNRKPCWPFLDLAIRPTALANVFLQYAVPTFPIAEPPVLTFTTFMTLGVAGATWGSLSVRLTARFSRIVIVDLSGGGNSAYFSLFVRSN